VTVDGNTHNLPYPFVVLATQNPVGSAGTQMLPNSQLDRFLIRINMGYPDFAGQVSILKDRHTSNPLENVKKIVSKEELAEMVKESSAIFVSDVVYEYITTLAHATREHDMVQLGISPRGTLALSRMAKAHAYVSGNDYVTPNDVAEIFPYVCGHRLVLNSKARLQEKTELDVLEEILMQVKMPIVKEIPV